eukprot:m.136929 g.136929  ORF g.136929 m.136929 type:complete len:600 (-) comp11069_c0_seq1:124-1923(-)
MKRSVGVGGVGVLVVAVVCCLSMLEGAVAQVPCGDLCYDQLTEAYNTYDDNVQAVKSIADGVNFDAALDYTSFNSAFSAEESQIIELNGVLSGFPSRHSNLLARLGTIHKDIQAYKDNELRLAAELLNEASTLKTYVDAQITVGQSVLTRVSTSLDRGVSREQRGSVIRDLTKDIVRSSTSCATQMLVNQDELGNALSVGESLAVVASTHFICTTSTHTEALSSEGQLTSTLLETQRQLSIDKELFLDTSIETRGLSSQLASMIDEGAILSDRVTTQAGTNADVTSEVERVSSLRQAVDILAVSVVSDPVASLETTLVGFQAEASELSAQISASVKATLDNYRSISSAGSRADAAIGSAFLLIDEVSTLSSMCAEAVPIAEKASTMVIAGQSIVISNSFAIDAAISSKNFFNARIATQRLDVGELIAILSTTQSTEADALSGLISLAEITQNLTAAEQSVASLINTKDELLGSLEATTASYQASASTTNEARISLTARAVSDQEDWCSLQVSTQLLASDVNLLSFAAQAYSMGVASASTELSYLVSSVDVAEGLHATVAFALDSNTAQLAQQQSELVSLEARLDKDWETIGCLPKFCFP